jgi:O-antigen/teichoic acid export membrane protein
MTRLLMPEMFGIMALANVIIIGFQLFTDIGLNQGVVQSKRGDDAAYLNTAWTVQILRGGLICLFVLVSAETLSLLQTSQLLPERSVYADPLLPLVIAVLAINPLISGFASTRLYTASRNLVLGRVTVIEVVSQFASLVFMVIWAMIDRSIWALVAGALFASLFRVILSHTVLPGEGNALRLEWRAFWEIIHFGKWIFLTSILGFLQINGDRLILGGLTDSETLGEYAIAFLLIGALQDVFSKIIHGVAFPAFSEVVRERQHELKRTYYKFRLPLDVAILLMVGILFSAGHLVIELLYDERYQPAGHMLEILSISLLGLQYTVVMQCFMALGMPKLLAPVITVRVVALFVLVPFVYSLHGLDGAIWAIGANALFALPLIFYLKVRYGLLDIKRELAVLPVAGVGYLIGGLIDQQLGHLF